MAKRGRPVHSPIRQNILQILAVIGRGYGYQIHKHYDSLFPRCTRESVYYHLRKGVLLGEIELEEVKQEHGNYSWGTVVEKRYYGLGKNTAITPDARVVDFFSKKP